MTAFGATAVVVTAVRNDLKLWTIINIGSTIILWWSLFEHQWILWSKVDQNITCIGLKPQWVDAHVNNFLNIKAREQKFCVCYRREKSPICLFFLLPPKKNQNVNFFQIGLDPPPPPNVNFLLSIYDLLLISQKINLIKSKLWGKPPPLLLENSLHFFWVGEGYFPYEFRVGVGTRKTLVVFVDIPL